MCCLEIPGMYINTSENLKKLNPQILTKLVSLVIIGILWSISHYACMTSLMLETYGRMKTRNRKTIV